MASVLGACEGKETHEGGGAEGGGTQTWDVDEWLQAAEAFDLDAAVNGPRSDKGEVVHPIPNPCCITICRFDFMNETQSSS